MFVILSRGAVEYSWEEDGMAGPAGRKPTIGAGSGTIALDRFGRSLQRLQHFDNEHLDEMEAIVIVDGEFATPVVPGNVLKGGAR